MRRHEDRPFAYKVQSVLITALVLSFVLIMQTISIAIYQVGIVLLITATLIQIAFGNIPPETDRSTTLVMFAWMMLIVIAVFGTGMLLAPLLVNMGR